MAAAPDYDAIVRVVQTYVDGFGNQDVAKVKEAFHEDAWMLFTDAEGVLKGGLIREIIKGWPTPQPDGRRVTGRIISVTQAGDAANVLLGYDDARGKQHSWVDFHSLLRIDGVWKITNKTATHASLAGGR
jgi:hypothetical protein